MSQLILQEALSETHCEALAKLHAQLAAAQSAAVAAEKLAAENGAEAEQAISTALDLEEKVKELEEALGKYRIQNCNPSWNWNTNRSRWC